MELRRRGGAIWILLGIPVIAALAGSVFAWRKFHVTDEQQELTRYVELQVPSLLDKERAIGERLDRLSASPGPSPIEARTLLVGDVMPRLVALRRQAASVEAHTAPLRAINEEYRAAVDKLIDACRTAVRAIDDPALTPELGQKLVREKFLDAGAAERGWSIHLAEACVAAKLAPPR